jgi:hypothetical protein
LQQGAGNPLASYLLEYPVLRELSHASKDN